MIINIVLFDEESVFRIASRAISFFSENRSLHTTKDTIWLDGLFLSFSPQLITLNAYKTAFSKNYICSCLNHILSGEEVFVSDIRNKRTYINAVDMSTNFDTILFKEVV